MNIQMRDGFSEHRELRQKPRGVRKRANLLHTRENSSLVIFEQVQYILKNANFEEVFGKSRKESVISRDSAPAITMETPQ